MPKLPKLDEIGQERLKRGLLLAAGGVVLLGGVKLASAKGFVSPGGFPVSQEKLVDLGGRALDKVMVVLGKKIPENQEEGKAREFSGEVAGIAEVIQKTSQEPQQVVEKVIEKKTEEIIKMIKQLPEKQAERIRKEIMKEICKEVCKGE